MGIKHSNKKKEKGKEKGNKKVVNDKDEDNKKKDEIKKNNEIKRRKRKTMYDEEEEEIEENENEEEKIIIEDFSKELKIHPKKIKTMKEDSYEFEQIKKLFNEYRCSKCLKKIIIRIERKNEDNNLYIITKCKNEHVETKPILQFIAENKFIFEKDFKFYDFVPNDIRKKEKPRKVMSLDRRTYTTYYFNQYPDREDELFFICFSCKKIFDLKKSQFNKFNHEHILFEYIKIGSDRNNDFYGYSEHRFKIKDFNYLEKKIKEEKEYLNKLNELLNKNQLKEKYISYLKEIEAEINLIDFYYNIYVDKHFYNLRRFKNLSNFFNHTIIPFKQIVMN